MQYFVRHLTRFTYTSAVTESVMELRMQPRTDGRQRCLRFDTTTTPRAQVFGYHDYAGNAVHYFDIPGRHTRLDVVAEAAVEILPYDDLPDRLSADAWPRIDAMRHTEDVWDWLTPGGFAIETPALREFSLAIGVARDGDPLDVLQRLTEKLYEALAYQPSTTQVDSTIDVALAARAGVCQDFAHIMTSLVRGLGIPCRYVSGYIAPREAGHDRSTEHATHAWVEARLPDLGWIGFDPTNNMIARERHIAVAVGRDYGDVPPTRGVFKGGAGSELGVAVSVSRAERPLQTHELTPSVSWISSERTAEAHNAAEAQHRQFQQQQQQQQRQ